MTTTPEPRLLPPPRRTIRNVVILYVIAALLAVGVVALWHRVGQADGRASRAVNVAQANQQALQSANACIRVSCGTPVPTPSPTVVHGERGPGPTAAQIEAAVSGYCAARNDCIGTPSAEQVAAAVRAYCSAGACRGGRGATGHTGLAGAPGESGAAGDTGPAPSEQDIADAVTAYCAAHGDCTGPAGPKGDVGDQGATGPQGASGRGIASIDCTGLGVDQLTINYDDGTSQTVPCNVASPSGAPTS